MTRARRDVRIGSKRHEDFPSIIEIPKGIRFKRELERDSGLIPEDDTPASARSSAPRTAADRVKPYPTARAVTPSPPQGP